MNPLLFTALTMTACAVAHYTVVFLEPAKASWLKATALGVTLVVLSNIARWVGFNVAIEFEWAIFIVVAGGLVWSLYQLRPLNNLTVGACYVAGSYLLATAIDVRVTVVLA